MVLKAVGSLVPRTTRSKQKSYTKHYIYLPSNLVNDSQFPFRLQKQKVQIIVDGEKLIVSKMEE